MVAIISVMLILVTTISYSTGYVLAEGEEAPAQEQAQDPAAAEQPAEQPQTEEPAAQDPAAATQAEQPQADVPMPQVSASSFIVMSGSTSQIVAERHCDRKMQPGRITMFMTAMVVIDNMYNDDELNNIVDITPELAKYGDTFKEGESVSVGDLLNAMLVGGDEQAAEALASYSTSTRDIFISEMNSKSMELDIMDTQFENPSGAYAKMQYATAKDCAVITQAAIRYQKVKEALMKPSVVVKATSSEAEREIEIGSTNPLLAGDAAQVYKYSKGGIRGVMGDPVNAMQYAAIATKAGMQMIVVLMDSNPDLAATEARALLEYGDAHVAKNTIVKAGKREGTARVKGGAWTRVAGYTETKGYAYVPPEGSDKLIQTQVVMLDNLEAPLKEGEKVGEFRIYVADELKGTVDLVTKKEVKKGWPPSRIYISNLGTVIIALILIGLIALALRIIHVRRRRVQRAEAMRRAKIRELARKQLEIDEDRKRRNWTTGTGYEPIAPRATDIRREQLERVSRHNDGEDNS